MNLKRLFSKSIPGILLPGILLFCLYCTTAAFSQPQVNPATPATILKQDSQGIEWEYEFKSNANTAHRFLFIVPQNRSLTGELLSAEVAREFQKARKPVGFQQFKKEYARQYRQLLNQVRPVNKVGVIRHFQIVEVKMNTLNFTAKGGKVFVEKIRARIKFSKPADPPALIGWLPVYDANLKSHRKFRENVMARLVSNPDAMELFGSAKMPVMKALGEGFENLKAAPLKYEPVLRFEIDHDGIYKITDKLLRENGLDPDTINPNHLHLFLNGKPVDTYIFGGIANKFTARDAIIFYGSASIDKFSRYNVYQLVIDKKLAPRRMNEIAAPLPENQNPLNRHLVEYRVEKDEKLVKQTDNFLSIKDFAWVWKAIEPGKTLTLKFDCPNYVKSQGSAKAQIVFYLDNDNVKPAANLRIAVNNTRTNFSINNKVKRIHSFVLPYTNLKATDNVLKITNTTRTASPDSATIYLDHLKIHYARPLAFKSAEESLESGLAFAGGTAPDAHRRPSGTGSDVRSYKIAGAIDDVPMILDITNTSRPRFIRYHKSDDSGTLFADYGGRNRRYLVRGESRIEVPTKISKPALEDLLKPAEPVEYLLVSHEDFLEPAKRLADFHRQRGYKTKLVNVQAVYNHFNHGRQSPLALKAFFAYALRNWPAGGPMTVILVGDASSDYRGEFKNEVKNFIPTFTLERGGSTDRWASDQWFTTVCGEDYFSDFMLGRISVENKANAYTVVNKTIQYLSDPAPGPWQQTITMVSDDGRFDEDCEKLRDTLIPESYVSRVIALDKMSLEDNAFLPRDLVEAKRLKVSPQTTTAILDSFNRGSVFMSYHGHGSPNIWADERILFGGGSVNSDAVMMRNRARLPILINMTCNSGAIDYPQKPWNICITEDMMRQRSGGVIGCYVPTGPGIPSSHEKVCEILFHTLFQENIDHLGSALLLTQYRYLVYQYPLDMVQMFLYLGDPSIILPRPDHITEIKTEPSSISHGTTQTVKFSHAFANVKNGYYRVDVFDSSNRLVESLKQDRLKGKIDHDFVIPATADLGTWKIRAFVWDKNGNDEMLWSPVRIERRYAKLAGLSFTDPPPFAKPGQQLTAQIEIKNPTGLNIENGQLLFTINGKKKTVQTIKYKCPANSTIKLQQKIEVPKEELAAGLLSVSAKLQNYFRPVQPAELPADFKVIVIPIGTAKLDRELRIAYNAFPPQIEKKGTKVDVKLPVVVYATGKRDLGQFNLSLQSDSGRAIQQSVSNLKSGSSRVVELKGTLAMKRFPGKIDLRCNQTKLLYNKLPMQISLGKASLPNLKIDQQGIKVSPDSPIEGQTIFLKVPIENTGASLARDAKIEVYDSDPASKNAKPVAALLDSSDRPAFIEFKDLKNLYPGMKREVLVRWDPYKNAGTKKIWLKIDSKNQHEESNESDNIANVEIKVRLKHKLEAGRLSIQPTDDKRVIKISAEVSNKGESEARSVLLEFFSGEEQTKQSKFGEVLLPTVPPDSQLIVPYFHTLTDEDITKLKEAKGKITYRLGLKGSLQRISSVRNNP